ncbi:hypothetical protein EV586_11517 [Tumebacillus sp. BK434]|uniref:ABC transporter permease n=1 Tax=Tumebacillus sp. BK434 TaxID=2512169 RepID=UPI00104971F0|nr:hypothetical protein [Tumebacillus sp. BK434]TCP52146.1 hypothetical protein EV586_11517 [Tumebacillus sp. BK434]
MSYLWEQALQQLKRRKGKAWLLWIQLFLSLLIVQASLGMYQSKQQEFTAYRDAFGSDLYHISASWMGEVLPGSWRPTEPITTEQVQLLKQQSAGRYQVYQATRSELHTEGVTEPVMLIEMEQSLFRETAGAMGYAQAPVALISPVLQEKLPAQVQLRTHLVQTGAARPLKREVLDSLSDMYRFLPGAVLVVPAEAPTADGERQIWLKAMPEFQAGDRARLLKSLKEIGSGSWEYSFRQVLELQEEAIEQAGQLASMFLVFAGMILLIGTLGVLGINLIHFLSKRHEWAVHMVYGASRGDLLLVQLLQFLIIGGTALLMATGCANVFLTLNDVESAWGFGLGDGAALLAVTLVGLCTLLPFFGLRQVRLTDALQQER